MPRAPRTSGLPRWKVWHRLVAVLVAILMVGCALLVADLAYSRGRVHHGVLVWGEEVSGLTPQELTAQLGPLLEPRLLTDVRVTAPQAEAELELVPSAVGMTLDVERTAAELLAVGRTGGSLRSVADRISLWMSPRHVNPQLAVDAAVWQAACDKVALQFERLAQDAQLMLQGKEPKVVAADSGLALERAQFQDRMREAVLTGSDAVECPLTVIAPRLSTEMAIEALGQAKEFFSGPIAVRYQDVSVEVTPEELVQIAGFLPEGLASGRPVTVDTEQGRALLAQKLAVFEREPVDAQVVPTEDGSGYTVAPSQEGISVDWDRLLPAIDRLALQRNQMYVPLPVTVTPPRLTSQDAELLKERAAVASFTTYFSPANAARVNNIRQVAQLLDGRALRPGETFSFNDTVGPRTKAAGFDEAPVISNGMLTQGVGGGICQVSTTLFNAALLAGLPIVERGAHSFYIERYPVGRDATVSYGTRDLRFKNDTNDVLILNVEAGESYVVTTLSAANWDRYGVCEAAEVGALRAPESTEAHPRLYVDPALQPGERSALEEGIDGRTVRLVRRVYSKGGELLFEDSFLSEYAPKDWLVRVGA